MWHEICSRLFMKPKIDFWVMTPHAMQRITERKISMQEMHEIILSPEEVIIQGPKLLLVKTIYGRDDNRLAVVTLNRKESELWVVITVLVNFEKK